MTAINDIKTKIKAVCTELKDANIIAGVASIQMTKDPLDGEIPTTPYAYIMPPATESAVVDNRTLLRSYTFDILVVVKGENINTETYIEDLIENILNKFDNLPTLAGNADGGLEPASSAPLPLTHKNGNLVIFSIRLKVNRTVDLTY